MMAFAKALQPRDVVRIQVGNICSRRASMTGAVVAMASPDYHRQHDTDFAAMASSRM